MEACERAKILMGGYSKIALRLITGSLLAQGLSFAFIPAISRIYGPESFAAFAFWISVGSIIGASLSLKQEQFFLSRKEEEWTDIASRLAAIFLLATIAITVTSIGLLTLKKATLSVSLLLAFLYGLSTCLISSLSNIANVKGKFSALNKSRIGMSLALGLLQIGFGLIANSHISLLLGIFGSQAVYLAILRNGLLRDLQLIVLKYPRRPDSDNIKKSAISLLSAVTLAVATTAPPSALYLLGYKDEAGSIAILQRLLMSPVNLLAMPLSQAFIYFLKNEGAIKINKKPLLLICIGTTFCYTIFLLGSWLLREISAISYFLGDAWSKADTLIISMCLLYASLLIRHIITNYFVVREVQSTLIPVDIAFILLSIASTLVAKTHNIDPHDYLLMLNACYLIFATTPIAVMAANERTKGKGNSTR